MLDIIFFLLKTIGIILAIVIGIIILLLLTILFVPIRYRIEGKKEDIFQLNAKVSWFLRILYCGISYTRNQLIIKVRIFGKLFYDSSAIKGAEEEKKKRRKFKSKKSKKSKKRNKTSNNKIKNTNDSDHNHFESDTKTVKEHTEKVNDIVNESTNYVTHKVKEEADEFLSQDNNLEVKEQKVERALEKSENVASTITLNDKELKEQEKGFIYKIKKIWRTFIHIPNKIKTFFHQLYLRVKDISLKITLLWKKWERIKLFYETNRLEIIKIWNSIKKIVKHILPKKLSARVEFGTEDPAATGQLLGLLAVFYGYYGNSVQLEPNFQEEILQGEVFCKGRIRLFTLLIICIKLIVDKNFRRLIKNFNRFKEEL